MHKSDSKDDVSMDKSNDPRLPHKMFEDEQLKAAGRALLEFAYDLTPKLFEPEDFDDSELREYHHIYNAGYNACVHEVHRVLSNLTTRLIINDEEEKEAQEKDCHCF